MIYIVKTFVKIEERTLFSTSVCALLWRKRFIILTRIRLRFLFVIKYEVFPKSCTIYKNIILLFPAMFCFYGKMNIYVQALK